MNNFITFPTTKDKKPLVSNWQNIKESIKAGEHYGIQCGKHSNLCVVDIDVSDGGMMQWVSIKKTNPKFKTMTVRTPSKGLHLYFKYREGLKNWVKTNGYGIDVRTDGGYVMGYRSKGYKLIIDTPIIDMPDWLFNYLTANRNTYDYDLNQKNTNHDKLIEKALELFKTTDDAVNHNDTKNIKYDGTNILITMSRSNPSMCDICNRIHDNDNSVYLLICKADNKIMRGCCKSKSVKFLGNISEAEDVVLTQTPETQLFYKSAVNKVNDYDLKKIESREYYECKNIGKVCSFTKQYCSQYKPLMNCKSDIVAIKSGTGSGKTNAVAKILQDTQAKNVIIPTFRVGQCGQLRTDKFKCLDNIVVYSDKINGKKIKLDDSKNNIICQLESIWRIEWYQNLKSFVLVLDEAQQLKNQLTSSTFQKQTNAKRSFKKFKQLVRSASQIYLMDAHLQSDVIKWFQEIRGKKSKKSTTIFRNKFKKQNSRSVALAESPYDIIYDAEKKLKENKKIYIACNGSIDRIDAFALYLTTECKKNILVIHRETLHKDEVKSAMNNLNDEWHKYDGIIVSPSVQSGLSYDIKNKFDSIYGIFANYTSSSPDCIQMLDRIRHPMNPQIMVSISMQNNNIGARSEADLLNALKAKTKHIIELNQQLENIVDYELDYDNTNRFTHTDYFKLFINNTIKANTNKQFFIWEFLKAQRMTGFTIIAIDPMKEIIKVAIKIAIKVLQDRIKTQKSKLIAEIESVSDEEIKKIKEKLARGNDVTESEVLNVKKNNTLMTYDIKEDDLNESLRQKSNDFEFEKTKWFETYGDDKKKKVFKAQRKLANSNTFEMLLNDMKKYEMEAHDKYKLNLETNTYEGCVKSVDKVDDAMYIMRNQFNYQKWNLLISWLITLGYTINDMTESTLQQTKEQLLPKLTQIHKSLTQEQFNVLGKDNRLFKNFKELNTSDNLFFKHVLDFVNGSIRGEFGFGISRPRGGRRDVVKPYILNRKYDKLFTVEQNQPYHIPKIKLQNYASEFVIETESDVEEEINYDVDPFDSDESDSDCD